MAVLMDYMTRLWVGRDRRGSAITSNFKTSTPKTSTLKTSTPIWSTVPKRLLPFGLLSQNLYSYWSTHKNYIAVVLFLAFAAQIKSFRINIEQFTENSLTCYTCPDKRNNEDCNRWAPDKFCPPGHTVCETVHRFHHHSGKSVFVEKRCAPPSECTAETIGCKKLHKKHHKHLIECRSCCRDSYCNRGVPYNMTTSLQLSLSMFKVTPNTAAVSHDKIWPITVLLAAVWIVVT